MEVWLTDLARKVPRPLRVRPYGVSNPVWTPDGARLIFLSAETGRLVPAADGSAEPTPLVSGGVEGRLSPDGRWLAYRSGESGNAEIYLQRFPAGWNWVRRARSSPLPSCRASTASPPLTTWSPGTDSAS